ncbi:BMP family lipoprotein [Marinomonas ostreistagni]|uniref:BMP family lipoprotein n=1 Tax=Marinomonas ostreistagni TaxID=359209 RepID=UPI0019507457|nr:BMP family ABC transporter substrate-binding protein [Marinomonas ostreistagni]MBM6551999.1 BMP family ABC transporter substrate-binding protein [Marinomonas ostreistagni]
MKGALLASATALTVAMSSAYAADIKPAVVYDQAGKFDKSFNEGVYNGITQYTEDTGIKIRESEPKNEAQVEQNLRRLAKRGYSPIVAVGFTMTSAVQKVAQDFPDVHFTIIDSVVELDNVQSIVFKEHQGSFLVGALAAMASETDTVGFIGGMDIPLIRKFGCGYEQGVKYVTPNATVIQNMTGSTGAAFNDPTKGSELAKSQFSQGADVVFAAAGGTGIGVYQAAKDEGKLAIGVDSNQNHVQPGTMLTSMVKRVDAAAYKVFEEAQNDTWQPGIEVLGLADGGVDWALDEHNQALISDEMKASMADIKAKIISGEISVHDYMSDSSCQY